MIPPLRHALRCWRWPLGVVAVLSLRLGPRVAAGGDPGSIVRVGSAFHEAVQPSIRGDRPRFALVRKQYATPEEAVRPNTDPTRAGSGGRVLQLIPLDDVLDGRTPWDVTWQYAYPFDRDIPRPILWATAAWNHSETDVWVFTSRSSRLGSRVSAFLVDLRARVPAVDRELAEWPAELKPASSFDVEDPNPKEDWRIDRMQAISEKRGFVLALYGPAAPQTRWLRFDTERLTWSVATLAELGESSAKAR